MMKQFFFVFQTLPVTMIDPDQISNTDPLNAVTAKTPLNCDLSITYSDTQRRYAAYIPQSRNAASNEHDYMVTFGYNTSDTSLLGAKISAIGYKEAGVASVIKKLEDFSEYGKLMQRITIQIEGEDYFVYPDSFVMIPNGSRLTRVTMDWGGGAMNGLNNP